MSDAPELAGTTAASVQQRMAFGERAGQQVRRIGSGFGDTGEHPARTGTRCASVNGFSLHANTQVPAHRREQLVRLLRSTARGAVALGRLLRSTARGAVALGRLAEDARGDLVYPFTKPLERLEKLAALVPLPRVPLVRSGGCLAPHSQRRGAIIPTLRQQGVWMGVRPVQGRLVGAGRGCCSGCLIWRWPPVPCADVARSASLPPSPKRRCAPGSCGI